VTADPTRRGRPDVSPFADVDPEVLARRASSFGSQAAAYDAARPNYPRAAVQWAVEPVRSRSGNAPRVLDLGAGTGKLTDGLLEVGGLEVVAVEPDRAMLARLRARSPHVRAEAGSAERIPLPDNAVDAIVVGQALHWFDLDAALPEMARVLTPGGMLACLWNLDDDRTAWVADYKRAAASSVTLTGWRPERYPLTSGGWFDEPELRRFDHAQRHRVDSLLTTMSTHSHVLVLPEPERAELLARVRECLVAHHGEAEFDLPIVTTVLRSRATKPRT
jgi:SAM-dependent methyltransferase